MFLVHNMILWQSYKYLQNITFLLIILIILKSYYFIVSDYSLTIMLANISDDRSSCMLANMSGN